MKALEPQGFDSSWGFRDSGFFYDALGPGLLHEDQS